MKRLTGYFMEGVLLLAPVVLTVYVVGRVLGLLETIGERYLLFGLVTVPGVGVAITVALITLVGWLGSHWLAARLLRWGERLVAGIPIVKSVYGSIKDVVDAFGGKKQSFSRACLVRMPETGLELLGFITNEELELLGEAGRERVAVYIPQSLQLGGFVAVVPRQHVVLLDAPPAAVLRFLMTAGMTRAG